MCGLCTPDPNAVADQCPPVYGPGADTEYGKDTEDKDDTEDKEDSAQTKFISHQSTMIFVMVIISFIISSYDVL